MSTPEIIRNLRTFKKYKGSYIAKQIGISTSLYSNYETAFKPIPEVILRKIAAFYNLTLGEMFRVDFDITKATADKPIIVTVDSAEEQMKIINDLRMQQALDNYTKIRFENEKRELAISLQAAEEKVLTLENKVATLEAENRFLMNRTPPPEKKPKNSFAKTAIINNKKEPLFIGFIFNPKFASLNCLICPIKTPLLNSDSHRKRCLGGAHAADAAKQTLQGVAGTGQRTNALLRIKCPKPHISTCMP